MTTIPQRVVTANIDYPESDGKPMGETDVHVQELAVLLNVLQTRYQDAQTVHVAGNSFIYYEEGNPRARFSPDIYVVFGVPKGLRRVYKLWEERQPPAVVVEFTSRSTMREDRDHKKKLCAMLGVREYFMCDPLSEYLRPPLQGFRLVGAEYRAIPPDAQGRVKSTELDVYLELVNPQLVLTDATTGERLLRPTESERARLHAERARLQAERARLQSERARLHAERSSVQAEAKAASEAEARRQAEAEIERLRAELDRLRRDRE